MGGKFAVMYYVRKLLISDFQQSVESSQIRYLLMHTDVHLYIDLCMVVCVVLHVLSNLNVAYDYNEMYHPILFDIGDSNG